MQGIFRLEFVIGAATSGSFSCPQGWCFESPDCCADFQEQMRTSSLSAVERSFCEVADNHPPHQPKPIPAGAAGLKLAAYAKRLLYARWKLSFFRKG